MWYYIVPQMAPTGLRYTAIRSRSITLQWEQLPIEKRGGPHNNYNIEIQGCNGSEHITTNMHITIGNLCTNSIYNISVKACITTESVMALCGQYSPKLLVKTLEDGM